MRDAYNSGLVHLDDIQPRIMSWIGHAMHGETAALRHRIFDDIIFKRDNAGSLASKKNRVKK
jgi:hypothetical protein